MPFDSQQRTFTELRQLVRENPKDVVFLTGAGVGAFSGLPLWAGLRDGLCDDVLSYISEHPPTQHEDIRRRVASLRTYKDLWQAFPDLQRLLGPHWVSSVQGRLSPRTTDVNPVYERIWKLNVKGIISFNLDNQPVDAFAAARRTSIDTATANEPVRFGRFGQQRDPFVLLPHGSIRDESTWVFTKERRDEVLGAQAYVSLMQALLLTKHLVLVGVNPRDQAFEYHAIQTLRQFGKAPPRHWILTDRLDEESMQDFRGWGLHVVAYTPANPKHHVEVLEFFDSLLSFLPQDSLPPPAYRGGTIDPSDLPPDQELARLDVEDQRQRLNAALTHVLQRSGKAEKDQTEEMLRLFRQYPRSIHLSWLLEVGVDGYDRLFGRKVTGDPLGEGSFGRVYAAKKDDSAPTEAVKLLLQEVKNDPRFLISFRRGVESMRILSREKVSGMVKIIDAYEVPPCVFMEYVPGPSLEKAVSQYFVRTLEQALDVLIGIGRIVDAGHKLEDRVLHRDLKPANVILKNAEYHHEKYDVVVLDFDLSWHKGAHEESVLHGARAQGYAAPEQTALAPKGVSTRHTAVDVFGFGMVMFYVFVQRHPRAGEQNFPGFLEVVQQGVSKLVSSEWKSLPSHLADLVSACTRDDQAARPGFSDVLADLRRCEHILSSDSIDCGDPLLLKEIAARVGARQAESLDFGRSVRIDHGAKTMLLRFGGSDRLCAEISRVRAESDNWRTLAKYLPAKLDRAVARLTSSGFTVDSKEVGAGSLQVIAHVDGRSFSVDKIARLSGGIVDALSALED